MRCRVGLRLPGLPRRRLVLGRIGCILATHAAEHAAVLLAPLRRLGHDGLAHDVRHLLERVDESENAGLVARRNLERRRGLQG